MKTVKDMADSLKVSKVSVYKAIKKDSIKKHTFKRDNNTYVDETGEKLLFALFNKVDSEPKLTDSESDNKPVNNDLIAILREQLKEKDAQINSLLNRIEQLINLNENSQKLQVTQMITDGKSKSGLWSKLFRKRGD